MIFEIIKPTDNLKSCYYEMIKAEEISDFKYSLIYQTRDLDKLEKPDNASAEITIKLFFAYILLK